MVHQECEISIAAGVGAQTVGNPHHPVAIDVVADVKIEVNLTPGTFGTRYGSVVVLGPSVLLGAAWVFLGQKKGRAGN